MDVEQVWATCLGELEVLLSKANFTTWFKDTSIIRIEEGLVIVGTPNSFTKEWLEKKYHDQILSTLTKLLKTVDRVEYIICSKKDKESSDQTLKPQRRIIEDFKTAERPQEESSSINPKYSFEKFVIGESNRLAHAAAQAVAKNPGLTYNPLFIYGGVGLGKTHLMQAIGNQILKNNKKKSVVYTTCEKFTNEFISLVRKGGDEKFKNNYRSVDVLLIDDIQFLAGKERTQEEFFHTFNALHEKDKQIVLTSDRAPKAISSLEARLVSRFEWGMIADINPPDFETRVAILQNKAAEKKQTIKDDIIHYIAKHIQNNIRELEGALNRILAYAELNNTEPRLEDMKMVLGESMINGRQRAINPHELLKRVADYYEITIEQLLGPRRNKELVYPRQICAYLLREELNLSFPKIGKELGGKDHTTIMHACNKIGQEIHKNDVTRHEINNIKDKLYVS